MAIRACDVMTTTVVAVPATLPVTRLEDTLTARKIGGAPVLEDGKLIGVVSRADVVRYLSVQRSLAGIAHSATPDESHLTVRDIMARELVVVAPETPIAEVARLMGSRHVHRILVCEGDTIAGLISALDLVQLIADERLTER